MALVIEDDNLAGACKDFSEEQGSGAARDKRRCKETLWMGRDIQNAEEQ